MDLIGEERGRLARAASWLDATPGETAGLAALLVCALVATSTLVWSALGRPALTEPQTGVAVDGGPEQVGAAAGAGDDLDGYAGHGAGTDHAPAVEGAVGEVDTGGTGQGGRSAGEVTVHVAGAVGAPGVVTLPGGARVADAVEAAGGLLADADPARINLARPIEDGEQLLILREGEEPPPPASGGPSTTVEGGTPDGTPTGGGGPVDLNTASSEQLQTLPGIGPALAARIIQHREQHGPFRAPGDLRDVSGIGEKRFQDLADLVTVG